MEDLISLPCYSETPPLPFFSSSSSLPPPTDPSPTTLQHRLQYLLHSSPEWWAYAIFWRPSPADHDGGPSPVLSWGGGHLRSARDADAPMFGRRRAALGCPGAPPDDVDAGATTDIEWFYVVSLTRSFATGDAEDAVPTRALYSQAPIWLAGADALQASGCARAREALLHGVETLVCIPAGGGVLELGSRDLIPENWVLLQQANAILTVPDDAIVDVGGPTAALALPTQQTWESSAAAAAGLSSSVDSGYLRPEKRQMVDKRPPKKIRGRKRRSGQITPMGHMEAERQRREKLNHLFCALRSVVPNVSRMDKASLLGDAVAYIKEMRSRVAELEAGPGKGKSTAQDHNRSGGRSSTAAAASTASSVMRGGAAPKMELEVRMLGSDEAIILMQSENMEHPPARLMEALRDLEVVVHHASVSTVKESVVVQDVVVRAPRLQGGGALKAALLARLKVGDDE